ncbi:hypothetical protein [Paraglaciecola chathamensis]|nr:hypothetical protein [Paraglaciecola oceanifecundans]
MCETSKQPEPPQCGHCRLPLKIGDTYCTRCNTFKSHKLAMKAFFHKPEFYIVIIGLVLSIFQVTLAFKQANQAEESDRNIQAGITKINDAQTNALTALEEKQTDALNQLEANLTQALGNIRSQQDKATKEMRGIAYQVEGMLPVRWDFVLEDVNSEGKRLATGFSVSGKTARFNDNEACVVEDLNTITNYNHCQNQVNAFCITQYKEKFNPDDDDDFKVPPLNVAGIFITTGSSNTFGIVCFNRPPS